jgi:Ca2+-binding EF-hand superfamily protein
MLERMGFTISQLQVYQLILSMDENFDGRLSYHELKHHINALGF